MLSFGFVIPTYNEVDDIGQVLDAVLNQRYEPIEVIVVDGGSTDGTVDLVRERADERRIRVIVEPARQGVSAARNIGIRAASTDVVVILNADVMPPADFTERLAPLYEQGADFVSVESVVANQECALGRFRQADHVQQFGPQRRHRVGWTEGFSCRREAALAVGFPEELPGAGGEDGEFFRRLIERGYRWLPDFSIVVPQLVPDRVVEYWTQWRGRGNSVPYVECRLRDYPLIVVTLRRAAVLTRSVILCIIVMPGLVAAVRRTLRSPRGWRDFGPFWFLYHVGAAAHRFGEWQTIIHLWSAKITGTQ
jgi:glycosyltransferase involved in cell wall biosynthesis